MALDSTLRPFGFAIALAVLVWFRAAAEEPPSVPPPSTPALEERVKGLEATVRQLEQDRATTVLPTVEIAKQPILAGWDQGFVLRSPDKDFILRITGQIQADYRSYQNDVDTSDVPTFLVRRARLGIDATVMKYYEFRLLPDYGRGESRITDAYFNVHFWDEFQFEVGKFKQPFSFEQLIQDRFVPTVERSLIDQLVPARDVGLMIHGQKLLDDRLDYGFSVYGGVINGDSDNDGNKDLAGRVAIRPFRGGELGDWLKGLQLGLAGTIGDDQGPIQTTTYRTPANVPWFTFASTTRPDGLRYRWSPELVYLLGPASLSAQYYQEQRALRTGPDKAGNVSHLDVPARGFYAMATYLVTGEERTSMSQAIEPRRAFDPRERCYGPGAWEMVARVSHLEFADDQTPGAFARLIDPARTARRATELTTGVNWYLNKWVRFQFNWEHSRFGGPVRLGPGTGDKLREQNAFVTRFQITF